MHPILMDTPACFETERLRLRSYQAGDGQWYYRMFEKNRVHLHQYESENIAMRLQNEVDAEILMREFAAQWLLHQQFFVGVFKKSSHVFVGQMYIGCVDAALPCYELGYFVDADHEGSGYITEAAKGCLHFIFHHLQATKVSLHCAESNTRSMRVAERCGFVKEGLLRANKRTPDGKLHNSLVYGLLREEFENGTTLTRC